MSEVVAVLKDAPIPTLLVVGGMVFLVLAVAGPIAGKIEIPPERQKWAGGIGTILLISGLVLYLLPNTREGPINPPLVATQTGSSPTSTMMTSLTPIPVYTLVQVEPNFQEVILGNVVYTILAISIERPHPEKTTLRVGIRCTNRRPAYDVLFWSDSFRLLIDGIPREPTTSPSERVSPGSAKDGDIIFELPNTITRLELQITGEGESTKIPLKFALTHP